MGDSAVEVMEELCDELSVTRFTEVTEGFLGQITAQRVQSHGLDDLLDNLGKAHKEFDDIPKHAGFDDSIEKDLDIGYVRQIFEQQAGDSGILRGQVESLNNELNENLQNFLKALEKCEQNEQTKVKGYHGKLDFYTTCANRLGGTGFSQRNAAHSLPAMEARNERGW